MNYGDGLYGGMLFGAMYAAAFFETDPHRVVEEGLLAIPAESGYARLIRDVLAWHAQDPDGLAQDLAAASRRSGTGTTCARTGRSCRSTSTRASTAPTSCWASSTATATSRRRWRSRPAPGRTPTATRRAPPGILGVMLGYERIPEKWKAGHPGARGHEVRVHAATRSTRSWRPRWRGPRRSSSPRAARSGADEVVDPASRRPRPRRSSSGTPACRSRGWSSTSRPGRGRAAGRRRR